MELWLIRHALPVRVDATDRSDTPADPGLSGEGHQQAALLAAAWGGFGLDGVVSSPLARARETAAPLAAAAGIAEVPVIEGLKEFDSHLPSYVPIEELRADPVRWQEAVELWLSPEAEAERQAFREVVVTAVDSLVAEAGFERLAVVCHGGVINAYLSTVLNLPGTMFFEPAYTSVSRVIAEPSHRLLVSVNESSHLGRLVVPATAR